MSGQIIFPAWIAANPLENLIPHINPQFAGKSGIEAAICYRLAVRKIPKQAREIDSAPAVKAAYRLCFGNDIPNHADTVLNAFMPFMDFCSVRLIELGFLERQKGQDIVLPLVQKHWSEVFLPEYNDLRALFDTYFDRMYCFSNLMPAPLGLNGCPYWNGKGSKANRDYPSEYMKNLRDPDRKICREYNGYNILSWLEQVIPLYHLEDLYQLSPPYLPTENFTMDKLPALEDFIRRAIAAIEARAEKLTSATQNEKQKRKYAEFLRIAGILQKAGITPLLFGSLGLEQRLHTDLQADDIDVLIPGKYLHSGWKSLSAIMRREGYTLCNAEEHEFQKDDIRIAYAAIESLTSFAGVDISAIPLVTDCGTSYLLLTLSDYLKVYRASAEDGYRKNIKNKQDTQKIALIEHALQTPETKRK